MMGVFFINWFGGGDDDVFFYQLVWGDDAGRLFLLTCLGGGDDSVFLLTALGQVFSFNL